MSTINTVSLSSNDDNGSWLFGSFDPKFNMIDSIILQDKGSVDTLQIVNGCYIVGIYYVKKYYQYELTNTLYVSDVTNLQSANFQCVNYSGFTDKGYNLKAVAALNKQWGLYDLSSSRNASNTINFTLCGNISKFIRDGVPLPNTLPNTCPYGYFFGKAPSGVCVGASVITAVANNFIKGFVGKTSLLSKLKSKLPGGTSLEPSSSSSNIIMFIIILVFIVVCIVGAFYAYKRFYKKTN